MDCKKLKTLMQEDIGKTRLLLICWERLLTLELAEIYGNIA
jgi:hypothetical protein